MDSLLEVAGILGPKSSSISTSSLSSNHDKNGVSEKHPTFHLSLPVGYSSDQRPEGSLKQPLSPYGHAFIKSGEFSARGSCLENNHDSFPTDSELEELSLQMERLSLNGTQIGLTNTDTAHTLSPSSHNLSASHSSLSNSHDPGDLDLNFSIESNFAFLDMGFDSESLDRISLASSDGEPVPPAAGSIFSTKTRCSICMDVNDVAKLACGHWMCRSCLSTLLLTALSDRSLLPVRCCQQPLSEELAAAVLPPEALLTLAQRTRQAQARDFMYCPRPSCSAFIDLDHLSAAGPGLCPPRLDCEACLAAVCAACRTAWHDRTSCADNRAARAAEARALEALAREEGWMRCGRCAVFVSRAHGCNHMTCACGHHFCYACGAPWKACGCSLWSEEERRLAEQLRVRAALAEEWAAQQRRLSAAEARAVRERVRGVFAWEEAHGECGHGGREHADGDFGECARCGWRCNRYGYRCRMCRLVFCQTCHFHRM